jgi:hypothetical protein
VCLERWKGKAGAPHPEKAVRQAERIVGHRSQGAAALTNEYANCSDGWLYNRQPCQEISRLAPPLCRKLFSVQHSGCILPTAQSREGGEETSIAKCGLSDPIPTGREWFQNKGLSHPLRDDPESCSAQTP